MADAAAKDAKAERQGCKAGREGPQEASTDPADMGRIKQISGPTS